MVRTDHTLRNANGLKVIVWVSLENVHVCVCVCVCMCVFGSKPTNTLRLMIQKRCDNREKAPKGQAIVLNL